MAALGARACLAGAQQPPTPPAASRSESPQTEQKEPELPAQIELLETHVRFEINGDSRKEVHTMVHINNELGARQFARVSFDYNRSFQQIEIPLLRITHSGGGTADILPSAVSDQPNAAVVNAPDYQDVRVKSVRLLGLAPGDTIEYRVVTATTHHPLAPDFWLEHTFDRSGVLAHEIFEVDVPASRQVSTRINPATPPDSTGAQGEGAEARHVYHWDRSTAPAKSQGPTENEPAAEPDFVLTTFASWNHFSARMAAVMQGDYKLEPAVFAKAAALAKDAGKGDDPQRAVYDFVAQKIATVDLSLGATGFKARSPAEILRSGYATAEDKCVLLVALAATTRNSAKLALISQRATAESGLPRPGLFDHILAVTFPGHTSGFWMDPAVGVAPYGMISSTLRRKPALLLGSSEIWAKTTADLPFPATQSVNIDATLAADGRLGVKIRYRMRGDNELALRLAFHQSARDKWSEVAQLLALADGFRGKVMHVTASDPYATKQPFVVEYEITQAKFVDWSKKPVRIPALLPQVGLPDPPASAPSGSAPNTIELGTPLAIETRLTLHLPPGTSAESPTGTAVVRDYAKFDSKYAVSGQTITAERHLSFLERTIPAERAGDYNAFIRAVQNDEAQEFTLHRVEAETASDSKTSESEQRTAAPKPPQ